MFPALDVADSGAQPFTDYSRWRLLVNDVGRHTWHYLRTDEECANWPQNYVDKFWLGLPLVCRSEALYPVHKIILMPTRISPTFRGAATSVMSVISTAGSTDVIRSELEL